MKNYFQIFFVGILLLNTITATDAIDVFLAKLTGKEILCEYITIANSGFSPGIYAINKDSDDQICVIPNGKKPVWSPDHKKFLFWYNGEIHIAYIENRKILKARDIYGVMGRTLNSEVSWSPDGEGIIFYDQFLYNDKSYTFLLNLFKSGLSKEPKPMWKKENFENVGKYSLNINGTHIVYESIIYVPGMFQYPETIKIVDIKTNVIEEIPKIDEDTIQYNPKWQPNGNLIAFETYNKKNQKKSVYFYNFITKKINKLELKDRIDKTGRQCQIDGEDDSTQLLSWSPSGELLLIQENPKVADLYSTSNTSICVVPLDDKKKIQIYNMILGPFHSNICWSSDSTTLSFISGSSSDPISSRDYDLTIWKLNQERYPYIGMSILEGLVPVNMSW